MNTVFGRKLGQYILLEQLGEGGMAKVYNAFDSRVERNVAIKVILPSKRTSSVFLQQFEREAKALASLTHTNIVKVLNYGVQDGQPYLVMEYVPGGTLKAAMDQKLPWQTAAAILAPIARALDYVHRQQIVHRDVKPSNILLQEDFRPMLSDFGVLKLLEGKEEKAESAIGAGIGTPEYMAPEQGMGKEVDFRADIYSLGMVFYEMITGQKPYTADSPMAVVVKHVTDKLPLPTQIDRDIPRYVERAILRAVQKNPKQRYLSMGHFADVLELIALGDKTSPSKIYRILRERETSPRQHSVFIASLSILLVALVVGISLFAYSYFRGVQQAPISVATASPAVTGTSTPASIEVTPTESAVPATRVPAQANATSPGVTLLGTPIALPQNSQFQEIARWGIGGVNVVRWSPDGKTIALGTSSGIFLYEAQAKEFLRFIDTQFNVLEMAFNPTGGELAAGSVTGIVRTWNPQSGEILQDFKYTRPVSETITNNTKVIAISYSADGTNIAIGYKNGAINYFSSNQGNNPILAVENYPAAEALAISADKRFIYASNGSKEIYIWDIQFAKKDKISLSNPTPINNLNLSHNQQLLLTGGGGNAVYLWDPTEPKLLSSFSNLGGRVTDFDFSNDDQYIAIALSSGDIKVFKTPGSAEYSTAHLPLVSINGFDEQILSLEFSPDELVLASGNMTEGLKLWDAQDGKNLFSLDQSMRAIEEMYLSSDGLWLATAQEDGLIRVWDVNAAKEAYPPLEGKLPKGMPFSPDNQFLAFIYSPGKNKSDVLRVMELKAGNIVAELPNYIAKSFVQFTDDSRLLVIGSPYTASFWDVATWEQVNTHGGLTVGCGHYFTPQNEQLAVIFNTGMFFTADQNDKQIEKMCAAKPPGLIFVYYFYAPNRMLFVRDTGALWIWDFSPIAMNRIRSTTAYPLSNEIFLAADQASGWYAYKDIEEGKLILKNIRGGSETSIDQQNDYQYRVALLPGKKLMALGSRYGSIHIWTMP